MTRYLILIFSLLLISLCATANQLKVLIVDTGIEATHPAFAAHSVHCQEPIDCRDKNGHGTHVASLVIGNEWTGTKPSFPVAPLELHSCNYFDAPYHPARAIAKCVQRGIELKVNVIVVASTGSDYDMVEYGAFKKASDLKIAIIVAAGNEGEKLRESPRFPAMYRFLYQLRGHKIASLEPVGRMQVVGALTRTGERYVKSNYTDGMFWERGTALRGAFFGRRWSVMTGTSQATGIRANKYIRLLQGLLK